MIDRPRARAFALLAALCAGLAYVGPSAAFDAASFSRAASAAVVVDGSAYNALSSSASWTCTWRSVATHQCTIGLVTNKGATGQAYRVMRETDTGTLLRDWALGGVAAASDHTSPWTTWTSEKAVGTSVAIIVNVSACSVGCTGQTYYANLTLEGKQAGVLEYNQTRIMVIIPPNV